MEKHKILAGSLVGIIIISFVYLGNFPLPTEMGDLVSGYLGSTVQAATTSASSPTLIVDVLTALTVSVTTDNFPNLQPGTAINASSTLTITTNATSTNVKVGRDDTDTTMDLTTSSSINITDQTAWDGSGNATTTANLLNNGDVLAFRVTSSTTHANFYSTSYWGTDDGASVAKYAGFAATSTNTTIADSGNNYSATARKVRALYYLDATSTQQVGTYNGGITYTITAQ